jgi:uncharacterized protein YkwD
LPASADTLNVPTIRTLTIATAAALLLSPGIAGAHPARSRHCSFAPRHAHASSTRSAKRPRGCKLRHARRRRPRPSSATHNSAAIAQTRAATIAAVLATPCQNTQLTPEAGNLQAVREAVLCLVNQVRAQHGVLPLALSNDLDVAAEEHGRELVEQDYFAHVAPDGETPVQRIRNTGYIPNPSVGYVIGENLAWGTYDLATPGSIVAAWVASPGHLANILEAQYRETGIAVVAQVPGSLSQGAPGATYAQEFGVIIE